MNVCILYEIIVPGFCLGRRLNSLAARIISVVFIYPELDWSKKQQHLNLAKLSVTEPPSRSHRSGPVVGVNQLIACIIAITCMVKLVVTTMTMLLTGLTLWWNCGDTCTLRNKSVECDLLFCLRFALQAGFVPILIRVPLVDVLVVVCFTARVES